MTYTNVTFNGISLNPRTINVGRTPGTIKQAVGTILVKNEIPGRTIMDYELTISGILTGASKATDRASLENDFQSRTVRAYSDGVQDGNYVIQELQFEDSGERPEIYDFTMRLSQWQQ
jgi:hypothetical protein